MKDPGLKKQVTALIGRLQQLQKYSLLVFFVLVAVMYGFLFLRIQNIANEQPANTTIDSQVSGAHVPHIDKSIVQKLQSLQDNSVSVHSLFDQARSNPFQGTLSQ